MGHQFKVGDRARLLRSPFEKGMGAAQYPAGTEVEIVPLEGTLPGMKLISLGIPHAFYIGWKKVGDDLGKNGMEKVFLAVEEDLEPIN